MEFRFELPDGYSLRDMFVFNRVVVKRGRVQRWLVPLLRLGMILIGAAMVLVACSLLNGGVGETPPWGEILAQLFAGIYLLALGIFFDWMNAWHSKRMQPRNVRFYDVTLTDDGLTEISGIGLTHCDYSAFTEACAYKEYWLLFLDKRHAEILPRSAMTVGDPDAFPAFWAEKTGIPIKKIK